MIRLQKSYYELGEVAQDWGLAGADLRYLIANDLIRLCVRQPYGDGQAARLVEIAGDVAGLVLRHGQCSVDTLPGHVMAPAVLRALSVITVDDLLIRQSERTRVEKSILNDARQIASQGPNFRRFEFESVAYDFTDMQAAALQFLFRAARAGEPEQHYHDILRAASSSSLKLAHLFSTRRTWTQIVHRSRGRRGWYVLNPRLVVAMTR